MYEQFNCIDYGDGRPGGDFSAGIDSQAFSKEQAEGKTVIRAELCLWANVAEATF